MTDSPVVLSRYLDGKLPREEAVIRLDRATVERAERESAVIEEDIRWGLASNVKSNC